MSRPEALWVLYDDSCGFCCRCADFLRAQDKLVPTTCLPRSGAEAKRWFGRFAGEHEELVVIDSHGAVYRGPNAFVMALWALDDFRGWAQLASREPLKSRARGLFHWLSSRRKDLSRQLRLQPESHIAKVVDAATHELGAGTCDEGGCAVPLPRRSAQPEP